MKSRLIVLVWFAVIIVSLGLACQPKEQPAAPAAEPNTAKVVAGAPAPSVSVEANEPQRPVETEKVDGNSVAVTVNGVNITEGQIEERIKPRIERVSAQMSPEIVRQYKRQLRRDALDVMIVEKLLDEKVKENNVAVTEADVNDHLSKVASLQGLSMADLKSVVEASGQPFDQIKEQTKKGLGYQKLIESQPGGKVNITEEDARKFYTDNPRQFEMPEEVRASHILIKPGTSDPNVDPNKADAQAKAKAEALLKQVKEGANFAELAKANSACPSAPRGGDLGFFSRGRMTPAFEKAAFDLKVGQVSDVVKTPFGYHIIKVTDHKDPNTIPFEQAKGNIIKALTQKKQNETAIQYVDSLKASAKIVYPNSPQAVAEPNESNSGGTAVVK